MFAKWVLCWKYALPACCVVLSCLGCGGGNHLNPPSAQRLGPPEQNQTVPPAVEEPAAPSEDPAGGDPPASPTTPMDPPAQEPPVELKPPTSGTPVTLVTIPASESFAPYAAPAVKLPAAYGQVELALPIDLAQVSLLDRYGLTEDKLALLRANGFVVAPAGYAEFDQVYQATVQYFGLHGQEILPVFVTTDSVLHVYHLLFDKVLRDAEDAQFYSQLVALTQACCAQAAADYATCDQTTLADPARRVWAYFEVARQLLSEAPAAVPAEIAPWVDAELALIAAQDGFALSPILTLTSDGYLEDYSQYIPRGHYTRTPQRQHYFQAMMWFGRINFRLSEPEETRLALMITRLLHQVQVGTTPAVDAWMAIYDPTSFLVGPSDDLSCREYTTVAAEVYGPQLALAELADKTKLQQFIAACQAMPGPRINSLWELDEPLEDLTKGFRLMGQRFVLDGYVFTQLLHPNVPGRTMPHSMDLWAAMGNQQAAVILDEMELAAMPGYGGQMSKLQGELAGLSVADWTSNVYSGWLYTLLAVISPKDGCFPPFMGTVAWARKDLHSAAGSWAELKHDTILYAKQPMVPGASAPIIAPPVQHWVEPCPAVYARLQALAQMTREGMRQRGLLATELDQQFGNLTNQLVLLQGIAEQELAGELIDEEESKALEHYGDWLKWLIDKLADFPEPDPYADPWWGDSFTDVDEPAAIVADVATDGLTGEVLEVGTGNIFNIFVVVPDGVGGLQVARGGTYSYYEFTWPMSNRLTDGAWRSMLRGKSRPAQPAWTTVFIVP